MDERQFYDERQETKTLTLMCPSCRREDNYPIRWVARTKKKQNYKPATEAPFVPHLRDQGRHHRWRRYKSAESGKCQTSAIDSRHADAKRPGYR